jgi:hypothetical protein
VDINYNGKLNELNYTLHKWRKRNLTPYGKIVVIKTLVVSQLVYLFTNLPDPSDNFMKDLNSLLFRFLWDEKRSKIKKSIIYKSHQEGGLRMINVYSFLSTLKISWLRRMDKDPNLNDFLSIFCPLIGQLHNFGSEYINVILKHNKNMFWMDVLRHYKKLHCHCTPNSTEEFLAETIFYNVNIKRGNGTIYIKQWHDAGILFVNQLLNEQGRWFSFEEFVHLFPAVTNTNYLVYEGIINAIKYLQNKINVTDLCTLGLSVQKCWHVIRSGNKNVTNVLNESGDIPTVVPKWNSQYNDLNWNIIFGLSYRTTADTRLRWFQTRLLHRILPTNKYLFMCKLVDSPLCTFCNLEQDSLSHLFWSCPEVNAFWMSLQGIIHVKCTHCYNFHFSEKLILFVVHCRVHSDSVMDLIILQTKYYIWKCKVQKKLPRIPILLQILKTRHSTEKQAAYSMNKNMRFDNIWKPYLPLLSLPINVTEV